MVPIKTLMKVHTVKILSQAHTNGRANKWTTTRENFRLTNEVIRVELMVEIRK